MLKRDGHYGLKLRILEKGYNEVSEQLGITKTQLCRKLNGHSGWSVNDVFQLSSILGEDPKELLMMMKE